MTSKSKVYVAGVGYSPSTKNVTASLISAATKALTDAGLTYDDLTEGFRSKKSSQASDAFKAFDEGGISIHEVENGSELERAFYQIEDKGSQCVLVIASENSAAIAIVLVSENKLWRHPYLKDSSTLIRKFDSAKSKSESSTKGGLRELCKTVWSLRGWSEAQSNAGKKLQIVYSGHSNQKFELSRADENAIPEWKEVKHKQDGKHRLGYNPAAETREISLEDFEAVRAAGKGKEKAKAQHGFKREGGDKAALKKGAVLAKL